jgi:hypothetical protein
VRESLKELTQIEVSAFVCIVKGRRRELHLFSHNTSPSPLKEYILKESQREAKTSDRTIGIFRGTKSL